MGRADAAGRSIVVSLDPSREISAESVDGTRLLRSELPVMPDPRLGACVRYAADAQGLMVPLPYPVQPGRSWTLCVWLRVDVSSSRWEPTNPDHARAVATAAERPAGATDWLSLAFNGRQLHIAQSGSEEPLVVTVEPSADPTARGWRHIAVQWRQELSELAVWVDGERIVAEVRERIGSGRVGLGVLRIGPTPDDAIPIAIGPGSLSRGALDPSDFDVQRRDDLASRPTLAERAPLTVRLSDDDDRERIVYGSDDGIARDVHVVFTNKGAFPLSLPTVLNDPRWDAPLELRFRPGAISRDAATRMSVLPTTWQLQHLWRSDGGLSLLIWHRTTLSLAPGESISLTLRDFRASPVAGSHTSHVELSYDHPNHSDLPCNRSAALRVVGRNGRARSPLRVGTRDDNAVLTGPSELNTVRLYIANGSRTRRVLLRPDGERAPTRILLSIEAGSQLDDWALTTYDDVASVRVSTPEDPHWEIRSLDLAEEPRWLLTPTRERRLGPGERLQVELSGVIADLAPGRTEVRVAIENVDGYWDAEHVVAVEKRDGVVKDGFGELLPEGIIVMWRGLATDVPAGWVLCDAANAARYGTPDLTDKFALGTPVDATTERSGGRRAVTLTANELPVHDHRASMEPHIHNAVQIRRVPHVREHDALMADASGRWEAPTWNSETVVLRSQVSYGSTDEGFVPPEDHDEGSTPQFDRSSKRAPRVSVQDAGGGQPFELLPPFYRICFIMKISRRSES